MIEVLEAHEEASQGLFRGIRHAGARPEHPDALKLSRAVPQKVYFKIGFLKGMNVLGKGKALPMIPGITIIKILNFAEMVKKVPDTQYLDLFGTLLVGGLSNKREKIF
ncbi:MAG: hypothetical protein Ct9H300mP3_01230 [Gammaproteobacteria bacterium]|nr:MAG: hypothetical protein Ct9H300mP3_01230 [Gammaproteobacteria bacterium]